MPVLLHTNVITKCCKQISVIIIDYNAHTASCVGPYVDAMYTYCTENITLACGTLKQRPTIIASVLLACKTF